VSNRLARFRDYMARFDAAASPEHAIERGFYVERPGRSVADEIAARIELRPASTHLLVGGVGSGKTTQLLVAARFGKSSNIRALYIDVGMHHDINRMAVGVVVLLVGLEMSQLLGADASPDLLDIKKWLEVVSYESGQDDGVVSPPGPLPRDRSVLLTANGVRQVGEHLKTLSAALASDDARLVVIIDSLDRLVDVRAFEEVVLNDMAAIRWAGIGSVLVGPLRLTYGAERSMADRFDYFYQQPTVDAQQDAAGLDFLLRVLRARAATDILPDASCRRLAEYSGGVLRDLITLAQAAGEEAYLAGTDTITEAHVEIAADAFGRKHLLGLGPDELEVLQRVRTKGIFVRTSDKDLALLVTRRVLEYQNGRPRYAVHPTIRPLLEQLAETP
jgi:hypothetical protein